MVKRFGTISGDVLSGTANSDSLYGGRGSDTLLGFGGRDHLFGGAGNDTLDGSSGNDVLYGSRGNDFYFGGSGQDTLTFTGMADGIRLFAGGVVSWNFGAAPAFDGYRVNGGGLSDIETFIGSRGNDRLALGDAVEVVSGHRGDDYIVTDHTAFGDWGKDILIAHEARGGLSDDLILAVRAYGGRGADILIADHDDARLEGGRGSDTFVFYDGVGDSRIVDFAPGTGDMIRFMLPEGASAFAFVNFAAMLTNTTDGSDGAVISWSGGSVTLSGVSKAELMEDWFTFTPEVDLY